ncbi:BCAM0308 family protein [Thermodesulfobium sp. 4217-1]|uniref:BCAM0308 family protein n=1 Tax=Thermodesulfobium sp. 4217-1 TaxID=3120013 RepID=UPI003221AF59
MSGRKDKLFKDYLHDPYFIKEKYSEPSVCERCGVVFADGIFTWVKPIPKDFPKMICPACKRIEDRFEGGIVLLSGKFLNRHKEEIINIVKNVEAYKIEKRPLERIMSIVEIDSKIEIKTTYEHLARRIGEAINSAFKGELKISYPDGEKYVRVGWFRDE